MKKTVEIRKPGMSKLDNSLHVQFHSLAYGLVKGADITKVSQISAETRLMQEKDGERDGLLTYIMGTIRNAQFLPDKDIVEAAIRIAAVIKPYNGMQNEGFDRETADIRGLVADLKKTENAADIAKLGLTPMLTKLETTNQEFDDLYTKRMTSDTGAKLPLSSKIRPETDAIYDRVILILQWNYLNGATPIDPEVIATLAENLCKLADRIDADYNRSLAQKRAAAKKKPKTPKDPKQPKEPKTPDQPKEPKQPETPQPPKPGGEKPKDPKKPGDDGNPDITLPEE